MKKHNLRETLVIPRAMVPHANGEAASVGEAILAVNVREREQSLQVTGQPAVTGTVAPGDRLLLIDGDHLITVHGTTVSIDGEAVVTLDTPIVGAHAIGPFIVIVTRSGFTYLAADGDGWTVMNPADAVPQLSVGVQTSTTHADIDAYTFAAPYSNWAAPLAGADTSALAQMLRTAWSALNADAHADGYHTAPMLVRWAVRLVDDTYLWISDAVRVGDATLANADRIAAVVTATNGGFTGTQATTMPLVRYRLTIDVTHGIASAWQPLVKSIDVFATSEAQLLTASRSLDYRCVTRTTGGREYVLEMGLSRRNAAAISSELNASSWHLVARSPATGGTFAEPDEEVDLTREQCAAVSRSMMVDGVVCSTASGGRLYCCTSGGDLVVSMPGNALVEAHRRSVLGAPPLAMAVVTRPLYSGGFGRYPVYVFTGDGVFAIPQRSADTLGEARLVDRTVIHADVAPVEGGGDVWFMSRHGHLCRLSGSKLSECRRDVDCKALSWCNAYGELWLLPASGNPVVRMSSGAMSERTVAATQLYSDPRHAVAVTSAGVVLDLEQEEAATVPVEWHTHPVALHSLMARRVYRVVWQLTSAAADLSLRVTGQRGIMAQDRDVSLITVKGAIDQPLAMAPILVPARTMRLHVTGTALSGTMLLPTVFY